MWFLVALLASAGVALYFLSRSMGSSAPVLIQSLAEAITDYEGKPGDRNYRNNNPGNLKDADGRLTDKDWTKGWGAIGLDSERFYIFDTWAHGFAALIHLLLMRVKQHSDWSILDLMMSYAPPSENDTERYAQTLARKLGASVETKIGALV